MRARRRRTRAGLDDDLKSILDGDKFKDPTQRAAARKEIKKRFEERFATGKNRWFFQKLRF